MSREGVLIVAHRGSSGAAPENTLAAFRKAMEDGADGIELDVRMTKDGELVVLHDQSVNRTTNRRGKIWDLTLAEVRRFDAGSWFGKKFSGERIPTLPEVMDLLPAHCILNIEVKTDGRRRPSMRLEERLACLLLENKLAQRAIVSSFDHSFLKRFHKASADIRTAALFFRVRDFHRKPSMLCRRIGASGFACSRAQLNKRIARDVLKAGLALACYGVNERKGVEKVIMLGANILITDYPKEIRNLVSDFCPPAEARRA